MDDRLERITQMLRSEGFTGAVRAVAAYVWWVVRGKPDHRDIYQRWMDAADSVLPENPDPDVGFSVVMPVYNTDPVYLERAVGSIVEQVHQRWQLVMVDDCSTNAETVSAARRLAQTDDRIDLVVRSDNGGIAAATNSGMEVARHEWTAFMDHDDRLHENALTWFSSVAAHADLIYSDEDKLDADDRRHSPTWKPAWSPRLLLGINYINHLTAVRTDLARSLGGIRRGFDGAQDHDFMLRLAEVPDLRVVHIPNVLYHWRIWSDSYSQTPESSLASERSGLKAVGEAVERRGWDSQVGLSTGTPYNYRPRFGALSPPPTVKIIIPTRDRVGLLRTCVRSVLERTDGADVHVVIIDNGSVKDSTARYLAELDTREDFTVRRIDDRFNYSMLCNEGARTGPDTEYLVFLNNDVEILARKWLQQMLGWLHADPDVCAVGTKLFYRKGKIQHAGVVLGLGGVAGHYDDGQGDGPKLNDHHDQVREVTAVTAALLAVRTSDFAAVGGFNEDMPLVYQDVDLCMRLASETGGAVLYDPTYPATHLGSASRKKHEPAQTYGVFRFQMLWSDAIRDGDRYYSPHLTTEMSDLSMMGIPADRAAFTARFRPRWSGPKPR